MMKKKRVLILFLLLFLFFPFLVFAQVRAYRTTSNQVIPNATITKVELNAESFDNLGEYDPITNFRFTALKVGIYLVSTEIYYATANAGTVYRGYIYKNGACISEFHLLPGATHGGGPTRLDLVELAAGDYIEIYTYHTYGSDQEIQQGSLHSFMAIHKFYSMPDIYTLIQNATTDAEFYLNKSLSYGDILILIFLTIFIFWGISNFLFNYYFMRKRK